MTQLIQDFSKHSTVVFLRDLQTSRTYKHNPHKLYSLHLTLTLIQKTLNLFLNYPHKQHPNILTHLSILPT